MMTVQSRPVNQRTSKWLNRLGRFEPPELYENLLRGSQLNRATLRHEIEQLHQAWPWSDFARFGPTTPKRATTSLAASVDPTEARNTTSCRRRMTSEGLEEVPCLRDWAIVQAVAAPTLSVQRLTPRRWSSTAANSSFGLALTGVLSSSGQRISDRITLADIPESPLPVAVFRVTRDQGARSDVPLG
jgi:hypothetical protein